MASLYTESVRSSGASSMLARGCQALARSSALVRLVAVFVALATLERLWVGISLPLWFDETWTAMIATRPDWSSFWKEAYLDVNAPFYYIFMKLWTGLAGTSNAMLRLPSLLFFYAAAALPLVWKVHGLARSPRLAWGALIILWWPGIVMTEDARTYGLLMFASVAGVIAFIQAYRNISARHLLLWAAICAVQLFSHYFAYFLVASQGLVLVFRWRLELVKRWYAFVPFAIPLAWTAYHLPRVLEYGKPGVAWYDPTDLPAAIHYIIYSFGAPSAYFPALVILAIGGALWKAGWQFATPEAVTSPDAPQGTVEALRWAVAAGGFALAAIIVVGAVKASVTDRYFVPTVPSMLLGVVLLASRVKRSELALSLTVLVYGLFALGIGNVQRDLQSRSNYGYELASDFVESDRPDHLIFLWDHSNTQILDETSLKRIGDFFMVRQGLPVTTQALRLSRDEDPNVAITKAVKSDRTAVIWLYDAQRTSAARLHPPRLASNPAWRCRDARSYLRDKKTRQTELWVGTLACSTVTGGQEK